MKEQKDKIVLLRGKKEDIIRKMTSPEISMSDYWSYRTDCMIIDRQLLRLEHQHREHQNRLQPIMGNLAKN